MRSASLCQFYRQESNGVQCPINVCKAIKILGIKSKCVISKNFLTLVTPNAVVSDTKVFIAVDLS